MLKDNLKKYRNLKGFTQDIVANLLNVKRQTYGAYERGVSTPDANTIAELAKIFDVSPNDLINKTIGDNNESEMRRLYYAYRDATDGVREAIDKLLGLDK